MLRLERAHRGGGPRARLTSEWRTVDGLRVHARRSDEQAPAGRLPLVLVHGLVVSSRYLVPSIEWLGSEFPVRAPDLPGFGLSDAPARPLDLEGLTHALLRWIEASGLTRMALLANSFGCQIAVRAARARPDLVARLILQGPGLPPGQRSLPRALWRFARNGLHESPALFPLLLRDYWRAGTRRAWSTLQVALRDRLEEHLPHVSAPTLVVSGELDALAPPAWGEAVARLLPHGRHVVLEGTPHTIVYEAPRLLGRARLCSHSGARQAPRRARGRDSWPAPPATPPHRAGDGSDPAAGRDLRGREPARMSGPHPRDPVFAAAALSGGPPAGRAGS